LPLVLVAAATLAVMGTGTFVVRQFSRPAVTQRQISAPPPLPGSEAGLGSPALSDTRPRDPRVPLTPALAGPAPLLDATVPVPSGAPVPTAPRALSSGSPAPRAEQPRPAASSALNKRRFRAGEARPSDF
jgi:hypothetical protein